MRLRQLVATFRGVVGVLGLVSMGGVTVALAQDHAPVELVEPAATSAAAPATDAAALAEAVPAAVEGEPPAEGAVPAEDAGASQEPAAEAGHGVVETHEASATSEEHGAAAEPAHADTPGDAHAASGGDAHAAADGHGAAEAHHGPSYASKVFNFVVFSLILFLLLRKPIGAFFRTRRADIAGSLAAAETAQREALSQLQESEARLRGVESQVAEILSRAREQAQVEGGLIREQAKVDATRVLAQAEAQVGDMEAAAVRRLKSVAADLAVDLARELVEKQLQPKDREEIFNRTLSRLQKAAN